MTQEALRPTPLPKLDQLDSSGLPQDVIAELRKIYEIAGDDPDKWGWLERVSPRCRAEWRGSGFGIMEIIAGLKLGKIKCPILANRYGGLLRTPSPADNILSPIAAASFPEKCELCNLKPGPYDYKIDLL